MCNMWKENRCGHITPLRAHISTSCSLERVNKRYDAAVKKLSSLTQGDKTLQGLVEWTKAHETVSRCIAELERVGKTALWLAVRLRPSARVEITRSTRLFLLCGCLA